jgi:hypothetical protein
MNPLLDDEPIIEYLRTDSNGTIVMDQIYFSVYGEAASYGVGFWALGTFTSTPYIEVPA